MCKKKLCSSSAGGLKPFFANTIQAYNGFISILKEQSHFESRALSGEYYHKDLKIFDKYYVLQLKRYLEQIDKYVYQNRAMRE